MSAAFIQSLNTSIGGAAAAPAPGSDGLAVLSPFDLSDRTVLITGGGSGIGLTMVEQFIKYGAKTIIITGRREDVLQTAQKQFPKADIHYYVSDAAKESDRIDLFQKVSNNFPGLSVLVHNAGIQRRIPLASDTADWKETQAEIDINFSAPVHLSKLFAPLLLKQKNGAAILHITGGVAFVALPVAPVYAATKAALHNFIISERISFQGTGVRVVEIVPPAVKSNLGGGHDFGEDPQEFCDAVFARWTKGEQEVGFKLSEMFRLKDRATLIEQSGQFAKLLKMPTYQNAV